MDSKLALEWVKKNKLDILDFTSKYKKILPYSDEDFMSAAYQAALVAKEHIRETDKPFNKYFWPSFETVLATFVPKSLTAGEDHHNP